MNWFEKENQTAYLLLFRIEIALRECLKASMASEFGVQWQKRLPGELLKKIKSSQAEESRPQFGFVRLGPLYYLTFGELLILLQQKAGRTVADQFGGDAFLKQLENIFVPRNALCHSRPVSSVGLKTIEALYAQVEATLTSEGLATILQNPDTGLSQEKAVAGLISSLESTLITLSSLPQKLLVPEIFDTARAQFWWADDSLAGFQRDAVETAIAKVRGYNAIEVGVGSAGTRLNFCEQHDLTNQIRSAIESLKKAKP